MGRWSVGTVVRWCIWCAAAILIAIQLFIPPIVGLSDQGDFPRVIGRFGYAREDKATPLSDAYVAPKYVRDPHARVPGLEQPTSEYIFVAAAVLLNKLVSRDGKLDIVVMGFVHAAVFLMAFARLLSVLRSQILVCILAALALTDVGYVAYWNSFYSEPASCIFFLLLLAESIIICEKRGAGLQPRERPPGRAVLVVLRWSLWAVLLVIAKPQNFPLALLLAPLAIAIGRRTGARSARAVAAACALVIATAGIITGQAFPQGNRWAASYNQIFLVILPDSKNVPADLQAFGLDARYAVYSGTGAWSKGSAFGELVAAGTIQRISHADVIGFYLRHPTRMWRRVKVLVPVVLSLRPEWCGNFEQDAGYPPGTKTKSFAVWSAFHERVLAPIGKWILILLLASPFAAAWEWIRMPARRVTIEFCAVLTLGCLAAFAVAVFGDAWDNVKHCFLFNLLLDACLITAVCMIVSRRAPQ